MTEAEWLACDAPLALWRWVSRGEKATLPRPRYLLAACCDLIRRTDTVLHPEPDLGPPLDPDDPDPSPIAVVDEDARRVFSEAVRETMSSAGTPPERVALLREIFGNPSRPPISPAWLTPAVVTLARAAELEHDLPGREIDAARLAVLSDALEEAGCDDAAILSHLRSPGPHVRGCWALDLILGKK